MKFVIFKLKHDIANDSELPLVKGEAEALAGVATTEISNLADLIFQVPALADSIKAQPEQRLQDVLLRMPYPGKYQALLACDTSPDFQRLRRRLTYCRDLFVICTAEDIRQ